MLRMNPWQHPIFDQNIHHLLALLTSLYSACGGVVYLVTDDEQAVTQERFDVHKQRLGALVGRKLKAGCPSMSMVQVSLLLDTHRSWAAILLKKSYDTLKNKPVEIKGIREPTKFGMDMSGEIHSTENLLESQNNRDMERAQNLSGTQEQNNRCAGRAQNLPDIQSQNNCDMEREQMVLGTEEQKNRDVERVRNVPDTQSPNTQDMEREEHPSGTEEQSSRDVERTHILSDTHENESCELSPTDAVCMEAETSSSRAVEVTSRGTKADVTTHIPLMDFSSCQRLDWSENMTDWKKHIKVKEVKTDDVAMSCPFWKTTLPMKVTPNKELLKHFFQSESDMCDTLSITETEEPGSAIVCRTWRFHISDVNESPELPKGHICDILTVTDTGVLSFWVVVDNSDKESFQSQMEYLMTTGRMLKYQIIHKGESDDMSNLWVHCRLLCLCKSTSIDQSIELKLCESQEIQKHIHGLYAGGVNFECLQRALTRVILSKESPLKRSIGDYTSITLSEQQVEVLMHKAKVNYISGPAGSGKSWTAASLYKMYGKEHCVYICTTREFQEFLKFNRCTGTLVLGDEDLLAEIKYGTFENKICVIIDDCHKFACTKTSIKKLFEILKNNRDMSLFVFADNDYQAFDRKRQQAVHECILDLTRKMLGDIPLNFRLTRIYRNTKKIVSFVQAAIQDIYDGHHQIQSVNTENGKGVECIAMEDINEELPVYVYSLLSSEKYNQSEIAILFESSCEATKFNSCKHALQKRIPSIIIQRSNVFPRTGLVVDFVESFLGLDSAVCVFVLSNTQKKYVNPVKKLFTRGTVDCETTIYNSRYEVFLASRAIHKAVFVVTELHTDLIQQMKFDHFQVCAR